MHKYFRAIGFSEPMKSLDRNNLVDDVISKATKRSYITDAADEDGMLSELKLDLGQGYGVSVVGIFDEENDFDCEYLFPYMETSSVSSLEEVSIEEQIGGHSYAGTIDDLNIGSTLIFRVTNGIDFLKSGHKPKKQIIGSSVCLSALSIDGTVLLPIAKTDQEINSIRREESVKRRLLNKARHGDEEAAKNLSMREMDTFSVVMNQLETEDLYTLVDSSFMPTGVECDLYSILGDIEKCRETMNPYTLDRVWILVINCNGLRFDLCINDKDLLGDPQVGRRFKGVVWMQGRVGFPHSDFQNRI